MRPFDLPEPDPRAAAASAALRARIDALIDAASGWIGFDRYMHEALYAPGLGYYAGGARKFGAAGDFVTAPESSPLFASCVAAQCLQWFERADPCVVEFGAGSGVLAAQLLAEFGRAGVDRVGYRIVEVSGELRARQRETIARAAPGADVQWEDTESGGTRMTLRNAGEPSGFAKVGAPMMAGAMRRANQKDLARLKELLERRG